MCAVAFRGTVTADEWLKDCKLQMTKSCGGLVHSGFLQHLDTVYEPLKTTVMNALADNGTVEVLLTGHSLGAAAATIFASKLQDLAPLLRRHHAMQPRPAPIWPSDVGTGVPHLVEERCGSRT